MYKIVSRETKRNHSKKFCERSVDSIQGVGQEQQHNLLCLPGESRLDVHRERGGQIIPICQNSFPRVSTTVGEIFILSNSGD